MIATQKYGKLDKTKIDILLSFLGDEGVSVFNTFNKDTGIENYVETVRKFTEFCVS